MGGSGFSKVKYNAREQFLSSDANRMQALASRDLQNLLADACADGSGVPITGLSGPCTLVGIAAQFNMTLSAQQALCWDPGDTSVTADDSFYEVARWVQSTLAFGTPAGNPRIDLVVVTPAAVDTNSQSRNILVDPVARTITPQNVFKDTGPVGTLAVVAGTPGATPAPPAVPAGAFALFEVLVPSGATDSLGFTVCPRMFRRAPFPWATHNGVVSGFNLQWDLSVTPGVADSTMSLPVFDNCRVIIDGELLDTLGVAVSVYQDAGSNNPFNSAAAANWHKPYYVYAVGGRHAPQASASGASPVVLVESLVPPIPGIGRPTSAITTPRGTTTQFGACYVGLGFVCANTTKRLPCVMDGEFTIVSEVSVIGPINTLSHAAGSANFEAFDVHAPPVVPVVSDAIKATLFPGSTVSASVNVAPDNGAGSAVAPGFGTNVVNSLSGLTAAGPVQIGATGVVPMPNPGAPKFWVATAAGSGTVALAITGFNHKVRKLHY